MLTYLKAILKPWYYLIFKRMYREHYRLLSKYGSLPRYQNIDVRFLEYTLNVPDGISFVYQFKELFLDESYLFYSDNPTPVIYDCGANIGLSCLYFKRLFPKCKLKAFEADPQIFKLLQANLKKNLPPGSVELYNKAIWIDNKGVEFKSEGADGGSLVIHGSPGTIRVESIRLKDLLSTEKIDLLKMDIEGAEVDVIIDCDGHFNNVDKVFFEYHSLTGFSQNLDKVLYTLSKNGFRYFIQSPSLVRSPFTKSWKGEAMDLQLNVYCYRS